MTPEAIRKLQFVEKEVEDAIRRVALAKDLIDNTFDLLDITAEEYDSVYYSVYETNDALEQAMHCLLDAQDSLPELVKDGA